MMVAAVTMVDMRDLGMGLSEPLSVRVDRSYSLTEATEACYRRERGTGIRRIIEYIRGTRVSMSVGEIPHEFGEVKISRRDGTKFLIQLSEL